jgi:HAD superfamily hydrolase (TIGR01509 family)
VSAARYPREVPVPPFRPQAVVFDLDGLLVDSEGRWGEAERAVVASYGRPWDEAIRTLLLGRGPDDAAARLAEHLGVDDVAEVAERMLDEAAAAFDRGIPVRPGARELVDGLAGRVPIAVATNSVRVLAEKALASSGLAGAFDAVVAVEDVTEPKPAPEPYLAACAALGADPRRSVALEDSPVGMTSARAAGLWVIGCPQLAEVEGLAAHVLVTSLTEVDPAALLDPADRGGIPGQA